MRAGTGNETMTGTAIDATSTAARYDALIRVSEALRAYHDRDDAVPQSRPANSVPSSGSAFWA